MQSRGRRLLLPALFLVTMVNAFISSVGAPLVAQVAESEHVSLSAAQWTLTVTLLSGAISVPILGRLGSHRHRRPVVLVVLALTALGALLAALPLGFVGILVGRLLQGIGMGIAPVAMGLAHNALPHERRTSALSLLAVAAVIGAGIGYPVAALIATTWGLSAAYLFSFAMTIVTLALAWYALPGVANPGREPRVDWWGAVLLSAGTTGILLGLTQGDVWGWLSPWVLAMFGVGVVSLVLWARRSLRIPNPLIDLRLTVRRGVLATNLTGLVAGTVVYMLLSVVTLLVQAPSASEGFSESPLVAGLMLVPYSIASFFGSRVNLLLSRRIAVELLLPIGCAMYVLALLLVAFAHQELWMLAVAMAVAGVGSGSTFATMPTLIVRHAPPLESSSAISANQLLRNFGFTMGSALAVTILTFFIPSGSGDPAPGGFTAAALVAAILMLGAGAAALTLGLRERRRPLGPEAPEDPTALEL